MSTNENTDRWLALYVLCAGVLMIVLDATIVNVALPTIKEDLGFSQSDLAWVVNAYLIAFGGLLLLSGRLGDLINWHWIFFVNLPIGVATALLALRLVEGRPGIGVGGSAGIPGAALVTGGLMLAVYTILGVEESGWGSTQTLGLGAVSIALVAAFVVRQARIENPLMPLRLFRSRNVSGANVVMSLLVVGMFGLFFLGALYLQLILGYDALQVGLAFLPATLVMGSLSLGFTDKLNMRFGPRNVLITGLFFLMAAMLLFARTPVDGSYWIDLFPTMLVFGVGAGVSFPALMMLAMSGATPSDAGLASGLVNTTAQVGGAIGLAVLATLTGGFPLASLTGAALAVGAIVTAFTVLRDERPALAHGEAPAAEPVYEA